MISKKQCIQRVNYLQGKSTLLHAYTIRAVHRRHMLRKIRKHLVFMLQNLLLHRQFHGIKIKNFYRRRKKYSKFLADHRKQLRVQYRILKACNDEESRLNRKLLELRRKLERRGLTKTSFRKYSLNTEKVQKEHHKGKVKMPIPQLLADNSDNNINSLVHFVKTGDGLDGKPKLNKPINKALKKGVERTVGNRTGKSGYRHSKSRLLKQSSNKEINNMVNSIPPRKKETSKSKSKSLVAKQKKSLKQSKHNVERFLSKVSLSTVDKSIEYQNEELQNPSRTSLAITNSVHSGKMKKFDRESTTNIGKLRRSKESTTNIGKLRRRSKRTSKALIDTMMSNSYDSISSAIVRDSVPSRYHAFVKHSRRGRITSIKGDEIVVIDGKRYVPASDVESEYRDKRKYLDGEMKKTEKKLNINSESESDEEENVPIIKTPKSIEKVESQTSEKKEKKNPIRKMGSVPYTSSKRKLTIERVPKIIVDIPQIIAARTRHRELFLEQLEKNAEKDKLFYEHCKRLLMLVKANVVPTQPEDLELLYDYRSNRKKYISTLESILKKLRNYSDFPIHNINVFERCYQNLLCEVFRVRRRSMLNLSTKDLSQMPSMSSNLDVSSYKVMDLELKDIEDIKAKWTQYFKEQEKTPMELQLEALRKKQKLEKLTAIKQAKCQRLSEKRKKALQMRPKTALYTEPRLTQRMRKVLEHINIKKEPTPEIKQSKILNTRDPEDLCHMKEKPLKVETETALQRFIRIYGQYPVVCI